MVSHGPSQSVALSDLQWEECVGCVISISMLLCASAQALKSQACQCYIQQFKNNIQSCFVCVPLVSYLCTATKEMVKFKRPAHHFFANFLA